MKYDFGIGNEKNWIVGEDRFDEAHLGKGESIYCQGNGYLGIRATLEESYKNEVRDTFVAGTFNQFEDEVTELPNVADLIQIQMVINGEPMDLTKGVLKDYKRSLNLKSGLLERMFQWESPKGDNIQIRTERFVSMENKHLIGNRIYLKLLNKDAKVKIHSGINGQVTNEGVQHFIEQDKRAFDLKYLQSIYTTTKSNIQFVINTTHQLKRGKRT